MYNRSKKMMSGSDEKIIGTKWVFKVKKCNSNNEPDLLLTT